MKRFFALALALMLCLTARAELAIGSSGEEVQAAQERLIELGYLVGDADGRYGQQTAWAVETFQRLNGLTVSGRVDGATEGKLFSDDAVTDDMVRAQARLIGLGILSGRADGYYGPKTADALRLFQRLNGLAQTGELNDATKAALFSADLPQAEPTAAPSPEPVSMEKAQACLIELGYLTGKADGIYGPKTAAALKSFQRVNGLPQTGELNDATFAALISEDALRDEVAEAQSRLIDLGYLNGSADGVMGAGTAEAIRLFQKMHGLDVTGMLGERTMTLLRSGDAKPVLKKLSKGDKGEDVRALQERLILLGFLGDAADGAYGKNTVAAVAAFQERLMLLGWAEVQADGIATPLTRELLMSDSFSTYYMDVAEGDENAEALRVERRLKQLGYFDEAADEVFDGYAAESLRAFQQSEGLAVTGVADEISIDRMFSEYAKAAESFVPHDIQRGDSGEAVRRAQLALIRWGMLSDKADGVYDDAMAKAVERFGEYAAGIFPAQAGLFDGDGLSVAAQDALIEGQWFSVTDDVLRIQRRLNSLYYLAGNSLDGDPGKKTIAAIERFQQVHGLEVTGVADEQMQRILFSEDAVYNKTPYKVEVSIDDQRVYVFERVEEEYVLIHTFVCSTGVRDKTPRGVFVSTQPLDRWHHFEHNDSYAQYAYQIEGNILFHSYLYYSPKDDDDEIQKVTMHMLGKPASAGCVRLAPEDAKWIYQNCKSGTIVEIY